MPLFKGRTSLLEIQNRASIKTARERAMQIDELERELKMAASRRILRKSFRPWFWHTHPYLMAPASRAGANSI